MDRSHITMHSGDSKTFSITVLDDNEDPVDLTGADISFVVSAEAGSTALIVKVMPDHIEVDAPETGVFTVPLDPEDTEDLDGVYYYEVEVIEASGFSSTVLNGYFKILPTTIKPA